MFFSKTLIDNICILLELKHYTIAFVQEVYDQSSRVDRRLTLTGREQDGSSLNLIKLHLDPVPTNAIGAEDWYQRIETALLRLNNTSIMIMQGDLTLRFDTFLLAKIPSQPRWIGTILTSIIAEATLKRLWRGSFIIFI